MKTSRTVFDQRSTLSGRVRVIEDGVERRLMVAGDTLSVYPLNGTWSRLTREYWWHAVAAAPLPARPSALFVGLGGGTSLHVLRAHRSPRSLTVIERDSVILRAARDWFGLDGVPGVEYLTGEAEVVARWLKAARRRFDFVFEDATYAEPLDRSLPLLRTLVPLISRRGVLVINRHRRGDAHRLAATLRPHFAAVRLRRVRREAENVLIVCAKLAAGA
ncbi:MAG: hypothetical protein AUH30_17160 [Candidatus Rokubacteria bacterium 13_1_40CM_68_15]|nr:MAG: hypothetical protein AUH30_17160 [Candidatus Rokubacteria bacterium 13_1_40CM_68_15]